MSTLQLNCMQLGRYVYHMGCAPLSPNIPLEELRQNMTVCLGNLPSRLTANPILSAIEALGSEGWNWQEFLKYFRKVRFTALNHVSNTPHAIQVRNIHL